MLHHTLSFQDDFDPPKSKSPLFFSPAEIDDHDLISDGNDVGVQQARFADLQITRGRGPIDGRAFEEFIKLMRQEQLDANIKA